MENFQQLIKFYQKENERGYIYINDELIEFQDFYIMFKSMQLETILEYDSQSWYLINEDGTWNKISVRSIDEIEEELLIFQ